MKTRIKAKSRLSLHPLTFDEAMTDVLKIKPEPKPMKQRKRNLARKKVDDAEVSDN